MSKSKGYTAIDILVITGIILLLFAVAGVTYLGRDYEMRKQAEYNAAEMKKQGIIKVVPQTTSTP